MSQRQDFIPYYDWIIFHYIYFIYIYHILKSYSSIDGYTVFPHILAIVNNAAVDMEVQISFQISVFVFFV